MNQYVSSLIRGVGWCDLPHACPKLNVTTTEHLGREPVSSASAPDQSRAASLASDRIRHIPVGTVIPLLPEQVQASSVRLPTDSRVLSVTPPRPLPTNNAHPLHTSWPSGDGRVSSRCGSLLENQWSHRFRHALATLSPRPEIRYLPSRGSFGIS